MPKRHKIAEIRVLPLDTQEKFGTAPEDLRKAVDIFSNRTPGLNVLRLVVESRSGKEEYVDISYGEGQLCVAINRS
jgi:hypothetical protein